MSWILIWSIDHTKTKQKIFDCWISGICWWTKLKEVNKTYSSFSMGIRRIWIMKIVMAESQTSEDNQNEASKRATSSFISGYQDYELIWSKHNPKRTVLYSLCTYEVYIWGKQNNFKYSTTEEKKNNMIVKSVFNRLCWVLWGKQKYFNSSESFWSNHPIIY